MNNTKEHQALVNDILLALSKLPGVRVWPRRVGLAIPWFKTEPVYYGVKGESDIDGIIAPFGRRLAIEVKTGTGQLTKEQGAWKEMIVKHGGIYIEARDLESVCRTVKSLL